MELFQVLSLTSTMTLTRALALRRTEALRPSLLNCAHVERLSAARK
jgi:hypothetical protein